MPSTDTSWKIVCAEMDVAASAARVAENFMLAIYYRCRDTVAVEVGGNKDDGL